MSFLEKLQNKSRYVRIQILWISVILVMIIIVFSWLTLLKSSFLSQKDLEQDTNSTELIPSLFGTLKQDFSSLKEVFQAKVGDIINNDNQEELGFEVEIIK